MAQAQATYGGSYGGWSDDLEFEFSVTDGVGESLNLGEALSNEEYSEPFKQVLLVKYFESLSENEGRVIPGEGWQSYVENNYQTLVDKLTVDYDVLGDYQRQMTGGITDYYDQLYSQAETSEFERGKSGFASMGSDFFDMQSFDFNEASRMLESERLGYRGKLYDQYDTWEAEFWNFVDYTATV